MEIFYFLLAMLAVGAFLLIYMYRLAFSDRVLEHELRFEEFPAGFGRVTIFFISDIHKRSISENIIASVKGKAEIVIIGGDLAEKGVPLERIAENIEKLKTIAPVFFVWGNNDYEFGSHELDSLLFHSGVKMLDNTAVRFEAADGSTFVLLGVDDFGTQRSRLDLALLDAGHTDFQILVSHNPAIAKAFSPDHNINLVLSGHTHGGQIRIFGFGPYEIGGIKKINGTTLFTSNGYGTTALPLRLGARPETHLITIMKDRSDFDQSKK